MGIKSTLTNVVARSQAEPDGATTPSAATRLELRRAPYTVTETSISIPRQRAGGSRATDVER